MKLERPEVEELVVATVESITQFGAYLKLEDYQLRAFLPISEVSSRWVRRVGDVIRVGERIVVKVIRVDEKTGNVDVSLKDVPISERRAILAEWEKNRKGRNIIKSFSEKSGVEFEGLLAKLSRLIEENPTIYEALERIVIEPSVLDELSFPDDLREPFHRFLSRRVKPKEYVFRAVVMVIYKGTGGIYKIKKFFEKMSSEAAKNNLKIKITLIGAPKYLVRLSSYKPGIVKKFAQRVIESAFKYAGRMGVSYQILERKLEK